MTELLVLGGTIKLSIPAVELINKTQSAKLKTINKWNNERLMHAGNGTFNNALRNQNRPENAL